MIRSQRMPEPRGPSAADSGWERCRVVVGPERGQSRSTVYDGLGLKPVASAPPPTWLPTTRRSPKRSKPGRESVGGFVPVI